MDYCSQGERLARIEGKLDEILTGMNGNGSPGIKSRLRVLETKMGIGAFVGGALVVAIIGLIIRAIEG